MARNSAASPWFAARPRPGASGNIVPEQVGGALERVGEQPALVHPHLPEHAPAEPGRILPEQAGAQLRAVPATEPGQFSRSDAISFVLAQRVGRAHQPFGAAR